MPKKKLETEVDAVTNSTNTNVEVKIVSDDIKPLELNVGGQLNVSGSDLQIVVDKLNELIRKK